MPTTLGPSRDGFALASLGARRKASALVDVPVTAPMPGEPPYRTVRAWRGDTARYEFRFLASPGVPLDLSGSDILFRLKWPDGVLDLASSGPSVIVDGLAGVVVIDLSAEQTQMLPPGRVAQYRLRRSIGVQVTTLIYGYIDASDW